MNNYGPVDDFDPQGGPDPEEQEILKGIESGQYVTGEAEAAGYYDPDIATDTQQAEEDMRDLLTNIQGEDPDEKDMQAASILAGAIAESWAKYLKELRPYLDEELKKPEYRNEKNKGREYRRMLFKQALDNAQAAKEEAEEEARLEPIKPNRPNKPTMRLQSPGTPRYYTSPNTTLQNAIQAQDGKGELIGAGPTDIAVLNIGKDNEVTIWADVYPLPNMPEKFKTKKEKKKPGGNKNAKRPVTREKPEPEEVAESNEDPGIFPNYSREFYRAVFDAAISLYADRKDKDLPVLITKDILFRTLAHKTKRENISNKQSEDAWYCFEYMNFIYVNGDASTEIQERNCKIDGQLITQYRPRGVMLPADAVKIESGGKVVDGYLLREPVLYSYAKLTGQLLTAKASLLDIREIVEEDGREVLGPNSIPVTNHRIAARSYLLRRIKVMQNDEANAQKNYKRHQNRRAKNKDLADYPVGHFRKQSRTILFNSLFKAAGINSASVKNDIKDYAVTVVKNWIIDGPVKSASLRKNKKGPGYDALVIVMK